MPLTRSSSPLVWIDCEVRPSQHGFASFIANRAATSELRVALLLLVTAKLTV